MSRIHSTSAPLTRDDIREQIESTLKFLPVPQDDYDRAYLEHNKLILIEDFEIENDPEFKALVLGYVPEEKPAIVEDSQISPDSENTEAQIEA